MSKGTGVSASFEKLGFLHSLQASQKVSVRHSPSSCALGSAGHLASFQKPERTGSSLLLPKEGHGKCSHCRSPKMTVRHRVTFQVSRPMFLPVSGGREGWVWSDEHQCAPGGGTFAVSKLFPPSAVMLGPLKGRKTSACCRALRQVHAVEPLLPPSKLRPSA